MSTLQKNSKKMPSIRIIRKLKAAEEFVTACDELHRMVPVLKKHGTTDVLLQQAYVFSINEGYGLSTFLRLLQSLYHEEGLRTLEQDPLELRLSMDPESPLFPTNISLEQVENIMLCVDLREWINHLDTSVFHDFLLDLYRRREDILFVFRVPYLEPAGIVRVNVQLMDVFSIRVISFVPWTDRYIRKIARDFLKESGYNASKKAMDVFQLRLSEEKSDGRFYGYQTVRRITDEMIYYKTRSVIYGGNDDDQITAEDIEEMILESNSVLSAEKELAGLVGMVSVREQLQRILGEIEQLRGDKGSHRQPMNMMFIGNPGTGKTTVARIVGKLFFEKKILKQGALLDHPAIDLIGQYIGETAPKTQAICRDAYDSVLYIDEIEDLLSEAGSDSKKYVREAISTLITQMDHRKQSLVVIFAGTKEEIKQLLEMYPELKKRVPYQIEFANFSRKELAAIYMKMIRDNELIPGMGLEEAVTEYFAELETSVIEAATFSNGRFVWNLFERTLSKTIMRVAMEQSDANDILPIDFWQATNEDAEGLNEKEKIKHPIGFGKRY